MTKQSPTKGNKPNRNNAMKTVIPKTSVTDTTTQPVVQVSKGSESDHDISFDVQATSVHELQKHFEHKLELIRVEFQTKVDTLYDVVKLKDKTIGELSTEIGDLKRIEYEKAAEGGRQSEEDFVSILNWT